MASFGSSRGSPRTESFRQTMMRPSPGSFLRVALCPRGSKFCSTAILASSMKYPRNTRSRSASATPTFLSRRLRRTVLAPIRQRSYTRNKNTLCYHVVQLSYFLIRTIQLSTPPLSISPCFASNPTTTHPLIWCLFFIYWLLILSSVVHSFMVVVDSVAVVAVVVKSSQSCRVLNEVFCTG
jgi:hypothetical protein